MSNVISFAEYKYRNFPWGPDPSPRPDAPSVAVGFTNRCACNAIESLCRALTGHLLSPRLYTDGEGNIFWRPQ